MTKSMFDKIITGLSFKKEPIVQKKSITDDQLNSINLVTSSTNVEILTHDKQSIDIVLETYDTGPVLEVSEVDQTIEITVGRYDHRNYGFTDLFNPTVCLCIHVPKDIIKYWHVKTSSGNVIINQIVAHSLSTTATSGNLKLSGLVLNNGVFRASSGNISMNQLNIEKCNVQSSSGNMTLENSMFHEGDFTCTSGNMVMDQLQASHLITKVTSGNIKLLAAQIENIDAHTTSGNIKVDFLNQELDATVDVTVKSGNIVCSLPLMIQKQTRQKLRGVIKDGNHLISLKSNSGTITVS